MSEEEAPAVGRRADEPQTDGRDRRRTPGPIPSLSLYRLLDPEVLADPYPLYRAAAGARTRSTGTRSCTPGS